MKEVILKPSTAKGKKYNAFIDNKKVSFGAEGYSDYTKHKDPERKKQYDARHKPNENWNDLKTAGAWSKWLLWNKETLQESKKDMEQKFNIKIKIT